MTDPCLGTQLVRLRFKGFCFSGSLTLAVSELGIGPRGITSLSLLHPELLPSLSSVLNYFPLGPDCSLFTHRPGGAAAFFLPPVSEAAGSFQVWEPRGPPSTRRRQLLSPCLPGYFKARPDCVPSECLPPCEVCKRAEDLGSWLWCHLGMSPGYVCHLGKLLSISEPQLPFESTGVGDTKAASRMV